MTIALLLTVLGMGLVFGAILLLWGLMACLVALTAPRPAARPAAPAEASSDEAAAAQAAAAAVAAALAAAEAERRRHVYARPPTASVSPWQAAQRAAQLRMRGPVR